MAHCVRLVALVAAGFLSMMPLGCGLRPGERRKATEAELALPKEIRGATDGSVLLLVPAGEFPMGPPTEQKRVTLKSFYMDRNEITNAQYAKFLAAVEKAGDAAWRSPDQPASKKTHVPTFWDHAELGQGKGDCPVVGVDWFDAYAYAMWADKRLPTEAEWEKAARGADARVYPWGNTPPEHRFRYFANFFGSFLGADGHRFTSPVGAFPAGASPYGCMDMAGNAAEWCADWFGPLPPSTRLADPAGPPAGTERVTKGGAWNMDAKSLHCFERWPLEPLRHLSNVGFRCAKDIPPEAAAPAK